jgi:hypothetical protein
MQIYILTIDVTKVRRDHSTNKASILTQPASSRWRSDMAAGSGAAGGRRTHAHRRALPQYRSTRRSTDQGNFIGALGYDFFDLALQVVHFKRLCKISVCSR